MSWNEKYAGEDYHYGTEPNDFLRERFAAIPEGRVLCLADGEGRNSVFLAGEGYDVTAVDTSEVGLAKARKLAAAKGVDIDFIQADLRTFDLGRDIWQGVVSIFCHLPDPDRADLHERIASSLAPGGVLLLEGFTPDQLGRGTGGPPSIEHMMSGEILRRELPGLRFDHLREIEREIREGSGHRGESAVVQALAIKS